MNSQPIEARRLRDCYGYLPLPYTIMDASGAAVRTLGALYQCVDNKTASTFASAGYLGKFANLPTKTVRRHLDKLERHCWITKHEPRGRRTCTIKLTKQALHIRRNQPYATLPRWWGDHRFPSAGLLYATLLAEHCKREEVIDKDVPGDGDEGDDYIPHLSQFSLQKLEHMTGLSRPAITAAKWKLREWGMVEEFQHFPADPATINLIDRGGKLLGMVKDCKG